MISANNGIARVLNRVNVCAVLVIMSIEKTSKPVGRFRVVLSQVLACLALDFLLIGLGMSVSFVTMVLPEVLDAPEGLSINKSQASWFGSMAFLCQPLGSVFSGPLLDYFGRKKALFLVNIPHLLAWVLMYSAWNVPSLFIANALLGIGTGIMEAPSVTYVGEVSDPSIRGILTTLTNGFTSTGIFVSYLLGTVLPWRQAALVSLTVPLATMAMVLFVPETPIWLISKGRQKEAMRSLCRLRGWASPEQVREEFDQLLNYNEMIHQCIVCIKEGLEPRLHENGNLGQCKHENGNTEPYKHEHRPSEPSNNIKRPMELRNNEKSLLEPCRHEKRNLFKRHVWKLRNIFFVKETMRPFLLVMTYFLFHTMSGLSPVRPNMVNLCKALGMKYDSKTIVVVVGAVHIIMSLISATVVKFTGKRKLILTSLLASGLFSLSISVYASTSLPADVFSYESHTFPDKKDILPVFLFLGLVCFYALGIPWVLLSEVFPFRSRGMATGLSAALSYIIFFLASKTNYNMESYFHISGTFAIYSSFAFVGTIYLYFTLPETEKKSLVEIEKYYKGSQKIFADDFFINYFRKKSDVNKDVNKPMLVNRDNVI